MTLVSSRNAAAKGSGVSGRATDRPLSRGLSEPEWEQGDSPGQPVTCRPGELRPHPSYVRLGLTVVPSKLSALAEAGELAFREPLVITRDRIIDRKSVV